MCLALSEDFQIWRHVGNFSSMLLMPWLMLWWLCSGPVTCCIINVSKPDSFDGCRHHLGPGSPCSLADNTARHAVSVSSWGFIQVVMAPTIRANKTEFSSDIFCRYFFSPPICGDWGLLRVEMHVCVIDTDGWQLVAGHDSCQLSSSAVLGSVPGPSLWRQWTPTSCARTVVTGGRSLSGAREHPPLPPLAPATLPAIRDSVYHMLWPDQQTPDSSLSVDAIMYTLSDIWTDDFYKVGGDAIVS